MDEWEASLTLPRPNTVLEISPNTIIHNMIQVDLYTAPILSYGRCKKERTTYLKFIATHSNSHGIAHLANTTTLSCQKRKLLCTQQYLQGVN